MVMLLWKWGLLDLVVPNSTLAIAIAVAFPGTLVLVLLYL
jgi:hypothetical protein